MNKMNFIALLKRIIINILINLMLVNLIFNTVPYNFTIQLRDFYLNKRSSAIPGETLCMS